MCFEGCEPSSAAGNLQTAADKQNTRWNHEKPWNHTPAFRMPHFLTQPSICGGGGNKRLTLYLLALICSTWNLLGQLHCETCRLTWRRRRRKSESKSTRSCIFSIPSAHLFIDLISIQRFPVWIPAGVKRADKLIVVNEAVVVDVKDARHCVHLQWVCGEFCKRCQHRCPKKGRLISDVFCLQVL